MTPDFAALRREFPVLEHKTYLNSGAYCALANSVRAAFNSYMDDRIAMGENWNVWVTKNEAVRNLMAKVVKCTPDEIAVTASASAGINSIASALDFTGKRNKIVVSDFEFPTNGQIWHAQQKRGAKVVHVPIAADGYIPLEHFEAAIDEQTQLVAVTHVCFRNGAKLDIAGIVKLAHAKGAKILIDCYQAIGAVDVDVKALDTDFLVGGMLKYLLGTAGIGFLYCRNELIETLVPTQAGWFTQENIQAMNIHSNIPAHSARRFEGGTPAVPNCYAAEAGLEFILKAGTLAIEKRVQHLTRRCMDGLTDIGWPSHTPAADSRRGPMVCVKSSNAAELSKRLLARDIVTSYRDQSLRATIHFYNTDDDIDTFIAAMTDLRNELR